MPQFQIVSDLHLETHPSYQSYQIPNTSSYLALVGDIGHVSSPHFLLWLEALLHRFWIVFFLLGNHEPWHLSLPNAKAKMKAFAEQMELKRSQSTAGKFIFLDQTRYDLGSRLSILGCTLFSNVPPEEAALVDTYMVDFEDTVDWTVPLHNAAHASDLAWLNNQVHHITETEPKREILILTHHSPCTDRKAMDPRHKGSRVSSAFRTDLRGEPCWTSPMVKTWAFGHTHYNCDFVDEETGKRVLTNQKGYYRFPPQKGFEVGRVYDIGD